MPIKKNRNQNVKHILVLYLFTFAEQRNTCRTEGANLNILEKFVNLNFVISFQDGGK